MPNNPPNPNTGALLGHRVFQQFDDDCFQAALATLMGLPLPAVPRFDERAIPGKNQNAMVRKWLATIGFHMDAYLGEIYRTAAAFHIRCGTSKRGRGHAAVYNGNDLYHDPHPEGGGIIGEVEQFLIIRPIRPQAPLPETTEGPSDAVVERVRKAGERLIEAAEQPDTPRSTRERLAADFNAAITAIQGGGA